MQDGKTPLDVAKEKDHSAVVELLSSDTQVWMDVKSLQIFILFLVVEFMF